MFEYNVPGIEMSTGSYKPLPPGKYIAQIEFAEEGITKNGDRKITVDYKIIDGSYSGRTVRYHDVCFFGLGEDKKPKKGAGISLHYLKSIGEPYQPPITVDEKKWIGKKLVINLNQELTTTGKLINKVKFVNPLETEVTIDENSLPF